MDKFQRQLEDEMKSSNTIEPVSEIEVESKEVKYTREYLSKEKVCLVNGDCLDVMLNIETEDTGEYITDDFIFEKDLEQRELAKLPDYLKTASFVKQFV